MKRVQWCLVLIFAGLLRLGAQSPTSINYQAVACDRQGAELTNQMVDIKLSILQGGATGTSVYREELTVETDEFGLFTRNIGASAAIQSGSIADVDWSNGPFFLRVEMDIDGDGTYNTVSNSQLLSVPYALYSNRASIADSTLNDNDSDPLNEIQTLSFENDSLSIDRGNKILLNVRDSDADSTNEIQDIEIIDGEIILTTPSGDERRASLYNGPFSYPGANFAYPQGLVGEYVTVSETNFTVPQNKVFYMTSAQLFVEMPAFSRNAYCAPFMPVFKAGTIVRNCNCTGFLVDDEESIEEITIDVSSSGRYIVPNGKTFFLKSGFDGLENLEIIVETNALRYERPNAVKQSSAFVFTEGTVIEFPPVSDANDPAIYTGYLISN